MGRTTKTDVREKVAQLNKGWTEPAELSFNCWGVGSNKYQLIDADGKTYGPVFEGAGNFVRALEMFEEGRRL